MAESDNTGAKKEGKEGREGNDRRRLNYLKMRAREIRAELAANKKESEELRKKMGMTKTKKNKEGGDDDAEGGEE